MSVKPETPADSYCLRDVIVSFAGVEIEVKCAGEEDLDLDYVMDVPRLQPSGSAHLSLQISRPTHIKPPIHLPVDIIGRI